MALPCEGLKLFANYLNILYGLRGSQNLVTDKQSIEYVDYKDAYKATMFANR
jgi:hypothetical protein